MAARILLIEDNAANLELMRYLLHAFGYQLLTASDGAEGIAIAGRELPDLVLCDVQMPDMDGYEVVRRLKAFPSLAKTPLVAVTALAMVGDRDKILALGFDGYIAKPIDPTQFTVQVEAFLPPELLSASRQKARATTAPQAKHASGGRTILAVDNVQSNLDFVAGLFEGFGYRVVTTTEAHKALELARSVKPDLIMSDVCMPEDSGFDLIRRVKADPALDAIPFVFITSTLVSEFAKKTGLELGAVKFLFRPIEPERLLAEIESCLPPTAH